MKTSGIRELKRALDRFEAALHDEIERAVVDEADAVRDDERTRVPVLTGELRDGIEVRRLGALHAQVGIFDSDLFWAVWIEWGRQNAPAQPFAVPAAEAARRRFPRRVEQAARRAAARA